MDSIFHLGLPLLLLLPPSQTHIKPPPVPRPYTLTRPLQLEALGMMSPAGLFRPGPHSTLQCPQALGLYNRHR